MVWIYTIITITAVVTLVHWGLTFWYFDTSSELKGQLSILAMFAPSHLPKVTAEMRWLSTFGSETISDPLSLRCSRLPSYAGHGWGEAGQLDARWAKAWWGLALLREEQGSSHHVSSTIVSSFAFLMRREKHGLLGPYQCTWAKLSCCPEGGRRSNVKW